ncbi:MAG: sodium/proton antiporter NhaB [Gammaproteobacteria bacterium]|nr:sodium/proton antiporter NhaB [Gammaproteobacteria bacterium]MYF38169.1 sodium/proton antiporter NhaB [Gammaproteobacteria bacterium]
MGDSPVWYKKTIVSFLTLNLVLFLVWKLAPLFGLEDYVTTMKMVAGWIIVLQFIFTLAMALQCYPLQPGGLIAIQAIAMGLASSATVYTEVKGGLKVILLLMFMVAGVFFMKELLLWIFTKIFVNVRSKLVISVLFMFVAAVLSAFLDALTVIAVVITIGVGFANVIDGLLKDSNSFSNEVSRKQFEADRQQFYRFLRNIMMHAAIGTALGGVCTKVGEPQNLLIADRLGWGFVQFIVEMAIVTMPVFAVGIVTCIILELTRSFSFGARAPDSILQVLKEHDDEVSARFTGRDKAKLIIQALAIVFLVVGLTWQWAQVGLIGLSIIVIQTAFNGVIREHDLGPAFEEALPFTALLVVFFAIVAVIHDQHLFSPALAYILSLDPSVQPGMFYIANGILSAISDNVFVATVYINEIHSAFIDENINRELFDKLGVAVNTGTNIPSVATPNGQAAFLFLLTSSLAPRIRLSYVRMVYMALPYTITLGVTGWIMVHFFL